MIRFVIPYGLALAAIAFGLDWLGYRHMMHRYSTEFYVLCIAVLFAILGAWVGHRLTPSARSPVFEPNFRALDSLGISVREREVLSLIAKGHSNKAIARLLAISPNTVKTHVARLFEKLDVASRTQAIERGRSLDILP